MRVAGLRLRGAGVPGRHAATPFQAAATEASILRARSPRSLRKAPGGATAKPWPDDGAGIRSDNLLDQGILVVRQRQARQVHIFCQPLVRKDDSDIRALCQIRGGLRIGTGVKLNLRVRQFGSQGLQRRGREPYVILPVGCALARRHNGVAARRRSTCADPPPQLMEYLLRVGTRTWEMVPLELRRIEQKEMTIESMELLSRNERLPPELPVVLKGMKDNPGDPNVLLGYAHLHAPSRNTLRPKNSCGRP